MTVPGFTASMDIICICIFGAVKYYRFNNRRSSQYICYRDLGFSIIATISIIDSLYSIIAYERQFITNIMRPFIVVLLFHTQQEFFSLVFMNVKDSFAMLFCLLIWVLYFAAFGSYIFSNRFEGMMLFDSFPSAYW